MAAIDTNKWSVLKNLSKDFVKNIKCIYVFGINGDQVIVITNDDNVYAFGSNSNACLGLVFNDWGHITSISYVEQPNLIPVLSQQQIINIEFGANDFVMALTKNGSVYSWGLNTFGQLCNGNTTSQYEPKIINELNYKNVIDIKTGKIHSLALTSTGDGYLLGYNHTRRQYNYNINGSIPTIMSGIKPLQKIISISSGLYHSLALTDNGDVYQWGDYASGKLMDDLVTSDKIDLRNLEEFSFFKTTNWSYIGKTICDINIFKIVCGPYHSLMLSSKGNVYCYGANNYGQCGDGSNNDKTEPTKIELETKFVDIGASNIYDISVGLSENGFCYVWGNCGERPVNHPIKTPFKTIIDVLEFYSLIQVTFEPLKPTISQNKLISRISAGFNKRELSDIAFKFGDKLIYAQKSYLITVCKYFEVMFSEKRWLESNVKEIEITNYSHSVYYAFIKYLHTDTVDVKPEDSLELLDLANCYLDGELIKRCAKIIKNRISADNVFSIYSSADKYNLMELKECCIDYFASVNFQNKSNAKMILENALNLSAN